MPNRAFWKAFHSLTHPVSISAVILLLLNDHVLRIYMPSWWTGKLGDFTWLIFAPMICALVVAWIVPKGWQRQPQIVGYISFGFIGVWFATAKTLPAVQQLTNDALSLIVGYQTSLRLDTTDLFTLPALFIGWMVWRRAPETQINLRPYGWAIIALGVLATVATSPAYDYQVISRGISCVSNIGGKIYAINATDWYNEAFVSKGSGLIWQDIDPNTIEITRETCSVNIINPLTNGFEFDNWEISLRMNSSDQIEISTDAGQTWGAEFDLSPIYDERRHIYFDQYHEFESGNFIEYAPGPYHALFDDTSGNLILAMGYDGLLVRDADANWQWVTVGNYRYRPNSEINFDVSMRIEQLQEELLMAFTLFFLVFATVAAPYLRMSEAAGCILMISMWSMWFFAHLFISPDGLSIFLGDFYVLLCIGIIIGSWLRSAHLLNAFYRRQNIKIIGVMIGVCCGIALMYLSPFVLWVRGIIPEYTVAFASGFIASILGAFGAGIFFQVKYVPILHKQPPKRITRHTHLSDLFYAEDEMTDDDML